MVIYTCYMIFPQKGGFDIKRFNKIEVQDWKAEGAMIELSKQVGELAKQVMIKERYYALRGQLFKVQRSIDYG